MHINVTCSGCNQKYKLPETAKGQFQCKKCQVMIVVPTFAKTGTSPTVVDLNDDPLALPPSTGTPLRTHAVRTAPAAADTSRSAPANRSSKQHGSSSAMKPVSRFPWLEILGCSLAVGMLVTGFFLMSIVSTDPEAVEKVSRNFLVPGLFAGLIGCGLFAAGLWRYKWAALATSVVSMVAVLGVSGFFFVSMAKTSIAEALQEIPADRPRYESKTEEARRRQEEYKKKMADAGTPVPEPTRRSSNSKTSEAAKTPKRSKDPLPLKPLDPVVYADGPSTRREMIIAARKFHRLGMEWYLEVSTEPQEKKLPIVQYVDDFLAAFFPLPEDSLPDWQKLAERGEKLVGVPDGGVEPLLMAATLLSQELTPGGRYDVEMREVMARFIHQYGGPRRTVASIIYFFNETAKRHGRSSWNFHSPMIEFAEMKEWMHGDFRATGIEHRIVLEMLESYMTKLNAVSSGANDSYNALNFCQFVWESENLPPWIRLMVRSQYSSSLAWQFRGGGYSNTVSKEGGEGFRKYMDLAASEARAAYKMNPWFPESSYQMIICSGAGADRESPKVWLERVQESQFDYEEAYGQYLNFILPKWGGNAEEMLEFGMACHKSGRYDTIVPRYLLVVLSELIKAYPDTDHPALKQIFENHEIYDAMCDCAENYIKEIKAHQGRSRLGTVEFYRTVRAMFAYRFHHRQQAVDELLALDEQLDESAVLFAGYLGAGGLYRSAWYVHESHQADLAIELERLWTSFETDEERVKEAPKIRALTSKGLETTLDPFEKDFWNRYELNLTFMEKYHGQEWADVVFDKSLTRWSGYNVNAVKVESPTTVSINTENTISNDCYIRLDRFVEGPKAIEATFQSTDKRVPTPAICFGIAVNNQSILPNEESSVAYFSQDARRVVAGKYTRRVPKTSGHYWYDVHGFTAGEPVRFHINIADGYFQVFANNELLVEEFDPEIFSGSMITIGTMRSLYYPTSFKVSDFRVKKWETGPPPKALNPGNAADGQVLKQYLARASKEFPENGWYHFLIAAQHYNAGDFSAAEREARLAQDCGMAIHPLALILARSLEAAGKNEEAMVLYQSALENEAAGTVPVLTEIAAMKISYRVALAHYAWLRATHPGTDVLEKFKSVPGIHPVDWVNTRIQAAIAASNGRFETAASMLDLVLDEIPEKYRDEAQKQLDQYQAGKTFILPAGTPSFLIDVDDTIDVDSKDPYRLQFNQ